MPTDPASEATKRLRLFVWEDVLCDYTPGMMVALAHSADEARTLLVARTWYIPKEDLDKEPDVYDDPVAFDCWGGS